MTATAANLKRWIANHEAVNDRVTEERRLLTLRLPLGRRFGSAFCITKSRLRYLPRPSKKPFACIEPA